MPDLTSAARPDTEAGAAPRRRYRSARSGHGRHRSDTVLEQRPGPSCAENAPSPAAAQALIFAIVGLRDQGAADGPREADGLAAHVSFEPVAAHVRAVVAGQFHDVAGA